MCKRFRISLRTLFIVTALLAVLVAFLCRPARRYLNNTGFLRFAQSPNFYVNVEENSLFGEIKVGYMGIANETVDAAFVAKLEQCRHVRSLHFSKCTIDIAEVHRLTSSFLEFDACVFRGELACETQPHRLMMGVSKCTPSRNVRELVGKLKGGALALSPPDGEEYVWAATEVSGFKTLILPSELRGHISKQNQGVAYRFCDEFGSTDETRPLVELSHIEEPQ